MQEVRSDLEAEGVKVPGIVVIGEQSAGWHPPIRDDDLQCC